jgi:hypothetical protein
MLVLASGQGHSLPVMPIQHIAGGQPQHKFNSISVPALDLLMATIAVNACMHRYESV